jgi:outer membrane protein OmpA-like peptidoglycan-associated protein
MGRFFILFLLLLGLCSLGLSDETEGKISFGLKGGGATYFGDIKDNQIQWTAGLSGNYWIANFFAIGFNGGVTYLQAEKDAAYFKSYVYHVAPMVTFKFVSSGSFNPFFTAGFEVISSKPEDKSGHNLPNFRNKEYEEIQYAIPAGLGFSIFLSKERLSLDLDGLYHYTLTDYLDDLKVGGSNDSYLTVTLGLSYYFGRPPDSDGDGIPDKRDANPKLPEDFDGFEDLDGSPDLDNDQDGIQDMQDKAPNDPEDRDGYGDDDGVPDLDNDGDGIQDKDDKCPGTDATFAQGVDTKEDIDNYQDEDGCPDPDNDGDGILDGDDKCPDEAETVNGFQDDDGCPDKKPSIGIEKNENVVLEGVTFPSGSTQLQPYAYSILAKWVKIMKENPEVTFEIRGFTDNTGSYSGNMSISQRRAESVLQYFLSQGISSSRLQAKGYGPQLPIAPNTTRDGRNKNRRIELYRIK